MLKKNTFICIAGIISALFAGQSLLRILREMKTLGGEGEFLFYLALWAVLYAIFVCVLKFREYGSRRLKVISLLLLAGSCLLLLAALPPSNLMLQALIGMALSMIFIAQLKYSSRQDNAPRPQTSRLRQMLARKKR
ncbi:MAG TPA: hypothetical protein H9768_09415 [Candidatus Mailhella merdavium]|nr:hypothetical protein [Candidatus Mailhella merdavium]